MLHDKHIIYKYYTKCQLPWIGEDSCLLLQSFHKTHWAIHIEHFLSRLWYFSQYHFPHFSYVIRNEMRFVLRSWLFCCAYRELNARLRKFISWLDVYWNYVIMILSGHCGVMYHFLISISTLSLVEMRLW